MIKIKIKDAIIIILLIILFCCFIIHINQKNKINDLNINIKNLNEENNNNSITIFKLENDILFINKKLNNSNEINNYLNDKIDKLNNINKEFKISKIKTTKEINNLNKEINKFNTLNVKFSEISLNDLEDFLDDNKIDENKYIVDEYDCENFAYDLIEDFLDKGYRAHITYLEFDDGAHIIVSINVKNIGIVFIEPFTDEIIYDLNIKDNYLNYGKGWKIEEVDYIKQ